MARYSGTTLEWGNISRAIVVGRQSLVVRAWPALAAVSLFSELPTTIDQRLTTVAMKSFEKSKFEERRGAEEVRE
jgi:hypothetical protein